MERIEAFLDWGGTKKDIVCLVVSAAALIISIFDLIPLRSTRPMWRSCSAAYP